MVKVFPISRSRYLNHIKWRVRPIAPRLIDWSSEFTPFSLERTDTDSCVFINGIPKAGTHLLNALIENLGYWKHTEVSIREAKYYRQFREETKDTNCVAQSSVKKLRNGQMVIGHVPWSPALEKSLGQVTPSRRFKHLLMYRDPRDAFFGHLKGTFHPEMFAPVDNPEFYGRQPRTEGSARFRKQWPDDDKALTWILKRPEHFQNPQYEAWLHNPICVPIRFEDLYAEVLDLQHNILGPVLRKLFDYLEIDASYISPVDLYHRVYGKSPNFSSEKDKIGQYKRVFKDHHYLLIDNPEFRHTLGAFGYEW